MKQMYLRSILALATALTLAGCGGGGNEDLRLGGRIDGLTKSGLVLANGGDTVEAASGAVSFAFTQLIATDDEFNVIVKKNPDGAKCTVSGGSGRASVYNVSTVVVTCVNEPRTLGGTVSGLSAAGLVLANGSDTISLSAGASNFTFPATVGDGASYGVTILAQPAGQTCTVSNGVGRMGRENVSNVGVICT